MLIDHQSNMIDFTTRGIYPLFYFENIQYSKKDVYTFLYVHGNVFFHAKHGLVLTQSKQEVNC